VFISKVSSTVLVDGAALADAVISVVDCSACVVGIVLVLLRLMSLMLLSVSRAHMACVFWYHATLVYVCRTWFVI
jgi:hypothetical protein